MTKYNFYATTPKGLELLLVSELKSLGADDASEKLAGVTFSGDIALAYKACLWSRLANRILLRLDQSRAETPEELYAAVQKIDWSEHLDPDGTLAVNFSTNQSQITHTLFGAQKVKDAIVDQFREKLGTRPNVDKEQPDVAINVYLYRDVATISIDLSGESLHKRGYRLEGGEAPLKENLAAAILTRANWKEIATNGGTLIDPMCGSGTLLIEGAQMAADIAPGLAREYFGFLKWKKFKPNLWNAIKQDAEARAFAGLSQELPPIIGYDINPAAIKISKANIERAGLTGRIHVEKGELAECVPAENAKPGLLVVNPPYGERLGEEVELKPLYAELGAKLKQSFTGWKAAVFTGNPEVCKSMGIYPQKNYALFNGTIPCKLFLFDIWATKPAPSVD